MVEKNKKRQDEKNPDWAKAGWETQLGDKPIEPNYRKLMNSIARILDFAFNGDQAGKIGKRKTGFILLVFPYGEQEGRCNYISNGANRYDVVVMLKEQIKRFEGQPEIVGNA